VALRGVEIAALPDDVDIDRDRTFVERCQGGDIAAFEALYTRYYDRLYRYCERRLHSHDEAEDATQEAFARAWRALPNFAGERRFYPWLSVIAGNICRDILRRRARSTPRANIGVHAPLRENESSESSEDLVFAAVDSALVAKALDRLSVRYRNVLNLREGYGWTYQQIATHEGVAVGAIETLLWRARKALKREFTELSESKGVFSGVVFSASALGRRFATSWVRRLQDLVAPGPDLAIRGAVTAAALTTMALGAAALTPAIIDSGPSAGAHTLAAAASTVAVTSETAASETAATALTAATTPATVSTTPSAPAGRTPILPVGPLGVAAQAPALPLSPGIAAQVTNATNSGPLQIVHTLASGSLNAPAPTYRPGATHGVLRHLAANVLSDQPLP
jgi:RNA polymerase sigma-70 factor (ECF subfamily)